MVLGPPTVLSPPRVLGPPRFLGPPRVLRPHKALDLHRVLGPVFPVCRYHFIQDVYVFTLYLQKTHYSEPATLLKRDSSISAFL